jgi:hypothetical protein
LYTILGLVFLLSVCSGRNKSSTWLHHKNPNPCAWSASSSMTEPWIEINFLWSKNVGWFSKNINLGKKATYGGLHPRYIYSLVAPLYNCHWEKITHYLFLSFLYNCHWEKITHCTTSYKPTLTKLTRINIAIWVNQYF